MEETPPALTPEPTGSKTPATSLIARLMNVFAMPGEVFEEVKASAHSAGNWLAPALVGSMVGVISIFIVLSQPAIEQQIREQQDQAIEKRLDKMVKAGQITRQQADQQKEIAEKFMGPTVMKISGAIAATFWSFARVFLWALVLWLLGMGLLKVRFGYLKAVEIAGLAGMIGVLGTLVKLLLQVNLSNLASSPSLAIAVKTFDPHNPWHLVLAGLNVFDLWELAVMALGLARLADVPFARAAFPVLGVWVIWSSALIAFATAMQRLFG
jgi:hypothetical protein